MKKALYGIFLSLLLASCGTTVYQLHSDCPERKPEEVFKTLISLLMREGFTVKESDVALGYLQAEATNKYSIWRGAGGSRIWVFQMDDGKIIGSAKEVYVYQNVFGAVINKTTTYFDDDTPLDESWYWSVRNALEQICGNKVYIWEKEI
ncbi:MAG: hypothetical protein ACM3U1_12605 [Chloroflexota bacterium]